MMKRRTTSIRATKTLYTAIYPQQLCDEHGERLARQVGAMQRDAKARLLSGTANPHASNPCDAIRSGQHIRTIPLLSTRIPVRECPSESQNSWPHLTVHDRT